MRERRAGLDGLRVEAVRSRGGSEGSRGKRLTIPGAAGRAAATTASRGSKPLVRNTASLLRV